MKKLWIIANFKSNFTLKESLEWLSEVGPKLHSSENLKVVACPDFLSLEEFKKDCLAGGYPLMVGAQDISPFPGGAFTGEEPAQALTGIVQLAILGHSERRENFSESDQDIAKKVAQSKESGILPLVCVQSENTPIPEGVDLVAYEPVFAIGTGHPDTPENADKVAGYIRSKHPQVRVLYGGSVTQENCKAFIQRENINGLLIGSASLDPEEFLEIIEECQYGG